ncbi:MAG: RIP homotypic interaction motif-containing protein [Pseudonocardiaceae bacterium]
MDPISLIVTALAAGAVAGAQGTATDAVMDAYEGLKTLVQRRLAGRRSAETALEEHESKPEAWRGALEAELVEVSADRDAALLASAHQLFTMLDAGGSAAGKYEVNVHDSIGVLIGDHGTITLTAPPTG